MSRPGSRLSRVGLEPKRIWLASLFFLASASWTGAEEITYFSFGVGTTSCAKWLSSPDHQAEGDGWVGGFWSGLNANNFHNHFVGAHSDAYAIWGEVRKICLGEPSTTLAEASFRVYELFEQRGL